MKRPREETRSGQDDPSKAPDPEEPEKFDAEKFQSEVEGGFKPPEDEKVVTLDPCKWVWSASHVTAEGCHVTILVGVNIQIMHGLSHSHA